MAPVVKDPDVENIKNDFMAFVNYLIIFVKSIEHILFVSSTKIFLYLFKALYLKWLKCEMMFPSQWKLTKKQFIVWKLIFSHFLDIFMSRDRRSGAYCFCPVCRSVVLSFWPPLWNFNLANNFWTVSDRAFIFHMIIPCYKNFPWVPLFFTLLPWPWSLTHFF